MCSTCAAAEHSNKICSKWPWTNCERKLSNLGYKLIFATDTAKSQRSWITQPSNILLEVDARKVNLDLAHGVISLANMDTEEITTYNRQVSEGKTPKRKRKRIGHQVTASEGLVDALMNDVIEDVE